MHALQCDFFCKVMSYTMHALQCMLEKRSECLPYNTEREARLPLVSFWYTCLV